MKPIDDPLSRSLAAWRIDPPRDPNFRIKVQARLQEKDRLQSWTRYARAHGTWVAGALAVAVLGGAWTGVLQAKQHVSAQRADAYVRAMDARVMAGP